MSRSPRRPARAAADRATRVSAAVSLAVVALAAAAVAALPHVVVVPDAVAVGARGLTAACLGVACLTGSVMLHWLLPRQMPADVVDYPRM